MKALICDGKIVDVAEKEFEIASGFTWIDCPDDCKAGRWTLVNGVPKASVVIKKNPALAEIEKLESTVTQRRIREMTTDAGKKWIEDVEAKIAIERGKL